MSLRGVMWGVILDPRMFRRMFEILKLMNLDISVWSRVSFCTSEGGAGQLLKSERFSAGRIPDVATSHFGIQSHIGVSH
jgi:hypothetical protein